MKAIGKIGVLIITFMVVASIFLFINIETYGIDGGMRFGAIQLLLIIGIPWFISYSKWANDNIWNKKQKEETIANPDKDLKSYLKYTLGTFVGIIALYWIQSNLLPTPDIPTGLRIGDYGLIGGVAFWIERTIKFITKIYTNNKEKTTGKIENQTKKRAKEITESNEKDGEQVVRNFTTVILIVLAIMLFVNILSF